MAFQSDNNLDKAMASLINRLAFLVKVDAPYVKAFHHVLQTLEKDAGEYSVADVQTRLAAYPDSMIEFLTRYGRVTVPTPFKSDMATFLRGYGVNTKSANFFQLCGPIVSPKLLPKLKELQQIPPKDEKASHSAPPGSVVAAAATRKRHAITKTTANGPNSKKKKEDDTSPPYTPYELSLRKALLAHGLEPGEALLTSVKTDESKGDTNKATGWINTAKLNTLLRHFKTNASESFKKAIEKCANQPIMEISPPSSLNVCRYRFQIDNFLLECLKELSANKKLARRPDIAKRYRLFIKTLEDWLPTSSLVSAAAASAAPPVVAVYEEHKVDAAPMPAPNNSSMLLPKLSPSLDSASFRFLLPPAPPPLPSTPLPPNTKIDGDDGLSPIVPVFDLG